MRLFKVMLASAGWIAAFTLLILPTTSAGDTPAGPIRNDALSYLAMAEGPVTNAPVPHVFRVGAPLLVRLLPMSPEAGFRLLTYLGLTLAAFVWTLMAQRLGFSRRAILWAALAMASTQGWANFFNNPYLTDVPGQLGIVLAWSLWCLDALLPALLLFAVMPLFRETVAPMASLFLLRRQWAKGAAALAVAAVSVLAVRRLPGMPDAQSAAAVIIEALKMKGPLANLGDAFASYHALWLLAWVGLSVAPPERRQRYLPPLVLMLLVGAVLSLLGNTVRMFTLALPFMGLAVAEFFEATDRSLRRHVFAVGAVFALGPLVWFPTRLLGASVSSHKPFQYVFGATAVVACVFAWRALVRRIETSAERLARPGAAGIPETGR